MKKITTRRIAFVGVLAALYIVLSLISVGTNGFKASFESFAVLIAGTLFGPLEGFLVGLIGEFVHQIIAYGIDPTTPLWLIPYSVEGLAAGLLAKKVLWPREPKLGDYVTAVIPCEFLLTLLVTPVNAVAAIIQGWGNWLTISAGIPLRLVIMAIRMVVYCAILPLIYPRLKTVLNKMTK